jgi:excisionase family DNA binding protein
MKWLTKAQAAELAGVKPRTIDRWIKDGRLTKYKAGPNSRRVFLNATEIKALFKEVDA